MSKRASVLRKWYLVGSAIPAFAVLAMASCGGSDPVEPSGSTASSGSATGSGGTGSGTGGTSSSTSGNGTGSSASGSGSSTSGSGSGQGGGGGQAPVATYTNPLSISIPSGGLVENCPDPTIIRGQQPGDENWYVYCTADALNDQDKDAAGKYNQHLIATLKSPDLVNWTYVGDALSALPNWADPSSDIWAPDVQFFNGKYHLYYVVVTTNPTTYSIETSAIAVATSDSPTGPWTQAPIPAIEPHAAACCAASNRWVLDPHIIADDTGKRYIYYGSYFGGLSVRALSDDGLVSDPQSQVDIAIPNRYEAAYVVKREGYYYLFGSATNCCNGPLSGYSVFAGRSKSPLGPFVDREGASFLSSRVGGTPVLSMNGNRWVGPGHSSIITDFAGQDWMLYHAVDSTAPYFAKVDSDLPLKRHLMLDPLDWIDGWPTVRGGLWASDAPQPAPAAHAGDKNNYTTPAGPQEDAPGDPISTLSDEFNAATLSGQWSWVREPSAGTFGLLSGGFREQSQPGDLYVDQNSASVLHEAAPAGEYMVETKVTLDMPAEGCCFNFAQAGLVIYKDDDNFIKLVQFSGWETRQVEFAKEMNPVLDGYPRYGNTVIGPPDKTVWLRVVKRGQGTSELYTGYSSRDGLKWVRGGTWTHDLGVAARIGLVAMASPTGSPFPATFDYVRVFTLKQ
jgi:arabinan endo-1,5-alpha-L-arabinosidase